MIEILLIALIQLVASVIGCWLGMLIYYKYQNYQNLKAFKLYRKMMTNLTMEQLSGKK